MNLLIYPIIIPIIGGIVVFAFRKIAKIFSILITLVTLIISIIIFSTGEIVLLESWLPYGIDFSLKSYPLSNVCILFATFIALLISIYSLKSEHNKISEYYSLILLNLGIVNGVFLSNNLVLFILFWEIAAIILYYSIRIGGENSYITATKSLFIIGFSDFCLLLGIIIVWNLAGTFDMSKIDISNKFFLLPFVLLCIGSIAKIGAIPFHSWIPDASKDAQVEIMAYLPASIDKLLGVYLLIRIFMDFFKLIEFDFNILLILMLIGALTIIVSLMIALVQNDLKKIIAYFNISSAGYLILGIATNTAMGIAGGMSYLISTVFWTSCLFLCSGSIEKQIGTTNIDDLGGLSKKMPITFFATLIAAISISGIPPFSGFFAKWIIYQNLIDIYKTNNSNLVILFLIIAMFGSALLLASSIKIIYSVFLGNIKDNLVNKNISDYHWTIWLPVSILSILSVIFGVFAYQIPLKLFIMPSLAANIPPLTPVFTGLWQPSIATFLIIIGLIIGIIIYLMQAVKNLRRTETYTYGEDPNIYKAGFPGSDFYLSITEASPFRSLYKKASKGIFDAHNIAISSIKFFSILISNFIDEYFQHLYEIIENITATISKLSSSLQGGLLSIYIFWSMVGFMVLLFILCR
ncbi:MAG TPA: hypothetical protein DCP53_01135 [Elusimicrobia bacterium]|nr:MAG: hypothetical protein A2551_05060 [Elusimicrobia bacterium RIFOXYD2_FULL_34_30]HAM37994.1 hypothetical protein [Elusimicrobiota bacterium]